MTHDDKVRAIAEQVRARAGKDRGNAHIAKGGVSHFVPLPGDTRFRGAPIDTSALTEILELDPERRRCVVEAGVSFERLVPRTLDRGLLPAVVPELKGITVGGAVAGCSVEAMSYRVGGLHDTCVEYEVVTGDGRVVTLSRERDPDLFERIHGSYGTLGIITRVTLELVPAKPYVRMEYRTLRTFEAFEAELSARCAAGDFDLIDGIVHAPDEHVVCLGRFVDAAPYLSDYSRLDVFYKSTRARTEDYLSTFDHCFRYDADCHWLTRGVPLLERRPVRRLLGSTVLGSTNLIRWSKRLERLIGLKRRPDVVCDVFIPRKRVHDFYAWYAREFAFFPLWVVPYRMPRPYAWLDPRWAEAMQDELHFDLAIYGMPNGDAAVDKSVVLEEQVRAHQGVKTLISRNHYAPETFWSIYDRAGYEDAKRRLDPTGTFPGVYEKFHRAQAAPAARPASAEHRAA
jgi:FAD/FMN-containing dehydrogenase